MIDDLHELLALRGHEVSAVEDGDERWFSVTTEAGRGRISFVPRLGGDVARDGDAREHVVLVLELSGDAPEGVAVLDLLGRRVHGEGGVVLESVREFCRKRGIRFEPGPWRYRGGLV
jgi:hypothetical protein